MRCFLAFLVFVIGASALTAQDVSVGDKTRKQWSALLGSGDPRVRFQAVAALYEEGPDAAPLVKELIPLLRDEQPLIRRAAAQILGHLKSRATLVTPALVAAMNNSDYWVRSFAAQSLTEIGAAATRPLITLLDDKDAALRYHAVLAITGLGLQGEEVARGLAKATKDPNRSVRTAALFALAEIESDDPQIFTILGEALRDKEKQVRLSAASVLVGKGSKATGTLVDAIGDVHADQRLLALQALAALGDQIDEKGVLALRKSLEDDRPRVRLTAALGLANLGRPARALGGDKELYRALAKLLQDRDVPLRRTAIHALGQMGPDDGDEVNLVAGALKDSDVMVRSFAVQALGQALKEIESEEVRMRLSAHLIDALKDADRRVQFLAAQPLARQTSYSVAPLTKLVEQGKGTQRLWAAIILGEIGPAAEGAVSALQKMSRDMNPQTRQIALVALQKIQTKTGD